MAHATEYRRPADETQRRGAGPNSHRIAFLITRADDFGGAQVHVRDLSAALRDRGHDVVVLTGPAGVLVDQLRERDVPVRTLGSLRRSIRPHADLRAIVEIRRALDEIRPDLLSTHSSKAGTLGRLAARSFDLPVLFTVHGWSFADGKSALERGVYRTIERMMAPMAARIVTVSEQDRELAIGAGVAEPDRIVTVHNAMPDVVVERADPASTPPRLMMVARFGRQKDHATLLRALARVADLDWTLELIGDGASRPEMEELARRLGIRPRVKFAGFRPDVARRLARAQLFVLTSHWEGFPRSIIEAMRAGLPVIASDVGGVREAVQEGLTGYRVPRGDADALVDRLRRLIADPEERARLGGAARALYEERFTFDRMLEETLAIYRDVLGRPAGPGERLRRPGVDRRQKMRVSENRNAGSPRPT